MWKDLNNAVMTVHTYSRAKAINPQNRRLWCCNRLHNSWKKGYNRIWNSSAGGVVKRDWYIVQYPSPHFYSLSGALISIHCWTALDWSWAGLLFSFACHERIKSLASTIFIYKILSFDAIHFFLKPACYMHTQYTTCLTVTITGLIFFFRDCLPNMHANVRPRRLCPVSRPDPKRTN